jgi:uncharacterized Tic20 family protein
MGITFLLPMAMKDLDSSLQVPSAGSPDNAGAEGGTIPKDRVAGDDSEKLWALFAHLGALSFMLGVPMGNIIVPLVIWLAKREASPFIDVHGKESVNFQITLMIYFSAAAVLCFLLIGFLFLPFLLIADIVLVFIAGIKAQSGETYFYPLTIRFIR